jgi:hypothetical protein
MIYNNPIQVLYIEYEYWKQYKKDLKSLVTTGDLTHSTCAAMIREVSKIQDQYKTALIKLYEQQGTIRTGSRGVQKNS